MFVCVCSCVCMSQCTSGGQRPVCGSQFSLTQAAGAELPSNLLPPTRYLPPKVPPFPSIGPLSGEQCPKP